MRVVIVKHDEILTPLIVSEEETVADLLQQWKRTANTDGDFRLTIVGGSSDLICETIKVKDLPLPSAGYSSIEVSAVRVTTLKLSLGDEIISTNLPLLCGLADVEQAVCEFVKCPRRPIKCSKGSQPLVGEDKTLMDFGIQPNDTIIVDFTIYLKVENLNDELEENVEISATTPLRSLFDEDVPKSEQRFYDSSGRQLNADELTIRSLGCSVGISAEDPMPVLYVRRMAIRVQPPPVSRDGFAEPAEQQVYVWPNKSVSCLLPREKPDLAVWFDRKILLPPATFWNSGVRPFSLLFLDKKMTVSINKDQAVVYKIELRRSSRIRHLTAAIMEKEGGDFFNVFLANRELDCSETALLRHCGIKDGGIIEIRYKRIPLIVTYEQTDYDIGSHPVFTKFSDLLFIIEKKMFRSLPANCYFQCLCGRRISMDVQAGQLTLPLACCPDSPRRLTLHRMVDVKVVEVFSKVSNTSQHVQVESKCHYQDILDDLEAFSGARLKWNGVIKSGSDELEDFSPNYNSTEMMIERKIAVGVRIDNWTTIRWLWPSTSLGSLMESLESEGLIGNGRVMIMDGTGHLASYGKQASPCNKNLAAYGIHDGTVVSIKKVVETEFASFTIISSKWRISNFQIDVPVPPTRSAVFKAVAEKLKGTRKEGILPVLVQVTGVDEQGRDALFSAANDWITTTGKIFDEPAAPAKFRELDPTVLYTPKVSTKIHIRRWADGSD